MNKISHKLTIIGCFLLPLILTACSTQLSDDSSKAQPTVKSDNDKIKSMIEHAQTLPSPESERLLIEAAQKLIDQGNVADAKRVLNTIDFSKLNPSNRAELVLLLTELAIKQKNHTLALELMTTNRMGLLDITDRLNTDILNRISVTRAEVWELNQNYLAAARERIFLAPMLTSPSEKEVNHQQIWLDLITIPTENLEQLKATITIPELQGWLQLAWIYKALQDNLDLQLERLSQWQSQHQGHPAAIELPTTLQQLIELADQRPQHIALLLPLTGKYKAAAEAILNGFLGAHYTSYQQQQNSSSDLTIKVYDSSDINTFATTYQTAVDEGAEIIIGPLQKENLRTLLNSTANLPVTTIALNQDNATGNNLEQPKNLFQFSLAPEADAQEVAIHARQRNFRKAAVLYEDSPWWQRAYGKFASDWLESHGVINSVATYQKQSEMANAVKEMLQVEKSQQRAQELKRIIGLEFEFHPRRRQDIDFIYLIAPPDQARQLRPLLDFYYAEALPVIAGSQIYSGIPSPKKDRDLNDIEFCDIPWVLKKPSRIRRAMDQAWPEASSRFIRLNALGVDAYRLHSRIQLLAVVPNATLFGATGTLSIDPAQQIQRQLTWAVMRNGKPELLPKIVNTSTEAESYDSSKTPTYPQAGKG